MEQESPKKRQRGTRTGFTTGACSAAAARAATIGLMTQQLPQKIETLLPNQQRVFFRVAEGSCCATSARAVVIKDAGDDPDVTDKAHLTAEIELTDAIGQITLLGGSGVGTVTMPGLGLEVGAAAINPVPRRNIIENIQEVARQLLQTKGLRVTISVPDGEVMAKRTLNGRLGIVGGISILGTTGIVHPWSTAAFRASVLQGIEVAHNQGLETVVLTTGGRTEKFVMQQLPNLPPASFVQMGDFLKPALDAVIRYHIPQLIIGGMVGKLTKMAQGETITHAGRNPVNTDLVADIAAAAGAPEALCAEIRDNETARFASEKIAELGLSEKFHQILAQRVIQTLQQKYAANYTLQVLVCDFEGNYLAQASSVDLTV